MTTTRTATTPSLSRRLTKRVSVIGAVAVAAAITMTAIPSTASAASWKTTGAPGTTTIGKVTGATTLNPFAMMSGGNSIWVPGRTITPSTNYRNYAQTVTVTDTVWSFEYGSWKEASTGTRVGTIPANGTGINFGAAYVGPKGYQSLSNGLYQVATRVTWQLSNGYVAGTLFLNYNKASDNQCYSDGNYRGQCSTSDNLFGLGTGGLWLGNNSPNN